jgi:hypothetical protein
MYERRGTRPIPRRRFLRRVAVHRFVATCIVAVSLVAGIAGLDEADRKR